MKSHLFVTLLFLITACSSSNRSIQAQEEMQLPNFSVVGSWKISNLELTKMTADTASEEMKDFINKAKENSEIHFNADHTYKSMIVNHIETGLWEMDDTNQKIYIQKQDSTSETLIIHKLNSILLKGELIESTGSKLLIEFTRIN